MIQRRVVAVLVSLLLTLCSAVSAQTRSITIGKFQYVGTGVQSDGTVSSLYQLDLDATGIAVDPIPFSAWVLVVKGTKSGFTGNNTGFFPITTGPGCGIPGVTVACGVIWSGGKGTPLANCASYNPRPQTFTQNCISIALQLVSLTGKNFSFPLVDGEQFCTYGITNIFLQAKPDQAALDPQCDPSGFCAGASVPVVLRAAPATSCK